MSVLSVNAVRDQVDRDSLVVTGEPPSTAELDAVLRRLGLGQWVGDGELSLLGRNGNRIGTSSLGHRLFVKRVGDGEFLRSVAFERFRKWKTFPGLLAPDCLGWDRDTGLMVFGLVEDALSGARAAEDGLFTVEHARRSGSALGVLHSACVGEVGVSDQAPPLPPLELLRALPLERFLASTAGELAFWRLVQHDEPLTAALVALRESESAAPPGPTHSDVRLDQFLLSGEDVVLTDWEEFRIGDPARDVGAFVGEWLARAVRGITGQGHPSDDGLDHAEVIARGRAGLAAVKPLLLAFWAGYRAVRPVLDEGFTARATAFAGWHLFDRLLATAQRAPRLAAVHRAGAGIGRNALLVPGRFADILGLRQ